MTAVDIGPDFLAPMTGPLAPPQFATVPINSVHESKTNPRRHFATDALKDLTDSIREKGILVPLLVRHRGSNGAFEVIAGARRYRAARAAGLEYVPVIVRDFDDKETLEIQVIENLQRSDVHPLEEAEGYEQLLKVHGYTVETLADKIGKSVSYLYQRLKLAALTEPAKKAFLEGELTAGHAILVARLQPKDQNRSLDAFFEKQWIKGRYVKGSMSVRALDAWIHANVLLDLNAAPWDKGDATLANIGACHSCPKRTGFAPALFPDIAKKDTCTDPGCFAKKRLAFLERRKAEVREKDGIKQLVPLLGNGAHRAEEYQHAVSTYDYKRVGAEACKYVERGIIIAGDGIGQTPNICRAKECKEHRGYVSEGPSASSRAAARRSDAARKLKTAIYVEALWTAVDLLPTKPGEPEFRLLIQALVDEMHHDALKRYCDIAKIERTAAQSYGDAVLKTVAKAKAPELFRVLFGLALVPDTIVYPSYYGAQKPERLLAAAKAYGFTLDAVEKKVRAKKDDKGPMAGFLSVACPHCRAKPGSPCKRPSEHNTFGGEPHKQRVEAAEALNKKGSR